MDKRWPQILAYPSIKTWNLCPFPLNLGYRGTFSDTAECSKNDNTSVGDLDPKNLVRLSFCSSGALSYHIRWATLLERPYEGRRAPGHAPGVPVITTQVPDIWIKPFCFCPSQASGACSHTSDPISQHLEQQNVVPTESSSGCRILWFKALRFGMICYTALDSWYKMRTQSNKGLQLKDECAHWLLLHATHYCDTLYLGYL